MRKLCCLLALCALLLSGCQLAQGEESGDWLIGMYVSLEPIGEDGERVYGVITSTEDGFGEITFPGVEGYPLYYYPIPVEDRGFSWNGSSEPDCIPSHVVMGEDIAVSQEGTAYVSAAGGHYTLYPNPVYYTRAGEVYVVAQEGPSGRMDTPGTVLTAFLEETVTYRIGKETKHEEVSVTCHLESVAPVERMILLQMREDNQVLDRLEVRPGQSPEPWKGREETAFILVETYYTEGYGEVSRTVSPREEPISVPRYLEDGRVVYDEWMIEW